MLSRLPKPRKSALVATMVAISSVALPAASSAEDAPLSFADMARATQAKVMALKSAPESAGSPFIFGHFLKPPPPPKTEEEAQEAPVALPPEIKCQGVMQMPQGTVVVINSGTYKRGDKLPQGPQITNITATEVTFLYRGKVFKLPAR